MRNFIDRYSVDLSILAGLVVCWIFVGFFMFALG